MRLLLIGMVMACTCRLLPAQELYDLDSLQMAFAQSQPDTNRVKLFIQLGQQYENNQPDTAIWFYEQALKLSEQLGYTRGIISYYTNVTYVYNMKGRYDTSLVLNLRSVEIAKQLGDPERIAACIGNVGASYMYLEQYEKAIDQYLQVIPIIEKLNDKYKLCIVSDNLGLLYQKILQYDKALQYGEQSVKLAREINRPLALINSLINLAVTYNSLGMMKKAIEQLEEASVLCRKANHQYGLLVATLNLADAHIKMANFAPLKGFFEEALKLSEQLGEPESHAIALRGMAIYYFNHNQPKEAERFANLSLQEAQQNNMLSHIGKAYTVLAEVSILKRDFRMNSVYSFKSDSIRNVLVNESVVRNVQSLEALYESERKAQQIKDLQQESEIKDLQLSRGRLVNYILGGSLFSLLLIALFAGRTYLQKKKLLEKENQIQQARILQLESEKQLMASEAIIKGQEEERGRLAKDLHDGLGGLLSGVKFTLTNMKSNVVLDANSALLFERSLDMLDNSITELRRVAHNMMPEVLVKFGLAEALKSYCQSVSESGVFQINFQAIGMENRIESNKEIILYRVVQELLNNIGKHAKATEVLVQVARQNGEIIVTVEDNGSGFDVASLQQAKGSGWTSIRSRIDYLKGKVDIQSVPGQGTSINLTVPV
ncbi:MAG: sensor histidine kinase [Flammeovirgaceae bacterium]|nr:MAG: sensor histidine kinase [Flammeovirgaceae bacterium]